MRRRRRTYINRAGKKVLHEWIQHDRDKTTAFASGTQYNTDIFTAEDRDKWVLDRVILTRADFFAGQVSNNTANLVYCAAISVKQKDDQYPELDTEWAVNIIATGNNVVDDTKRYVWGARKNINYQSGQDVQVYPPNECLHDMLNYAGVYEFNAKRIIPPGGAVVLSEVYKEQNDRTLSSVHSEYDIHLFFTEK